MSLPSRSQHSSVPTLVTAHSSQTPSLVEASAHRKSSLDIPQRIERKIAQYNASQNVFKRWLFEIISWMISAACMAAMIGILLHVQNQPLSKWPLALTINNVLAKVATAALILPISEAIGQLKWTWFNGPTSKEMIDFEIFDKASRGAWGSFLLLFRTKGRSLAALGATLTLLLLVTDTFFAQATDLPTRWALDGFGEIPRVVRYDGDNGDIYEDGMPSAVEDINLRQSSLQAFYYNGDQPVAFGNGTRPDIPLSCPSSRCEWDAYDSLGVCSACADVSELLTYACLTTRLDWISSVYWNQTTQPIGTACGYWLNATSDAPMLMSGYRVNNSTNSSTDGEALLMRTLSLSSSIFSVGPFSANPPYNGSINFKDVYIPVLDAIIVSAADGTAASVYGKQRPVAQECMLSLCVKTFKSSYAWGNYEEIVTDTSLNTTRRQQPYPWEVTPIHSLGEDSFWVIFNGDVSIRPPSTAPNATEYGVSNETYTRMQVIFDDIFPSSLTVENATATPWWRVKLFAWGRNQLRPVRGVLNCPLLAPNNVTQYMEKLAISMTNVIRSHKSHEMVRGRAYTMTTFIAVHWEWLTFPLALLFFSLLFLVATIIKTSKSTNIGIGMWKTSAMPTLIYSLPKDVQKDVSSPSTWGSAPSAGGKKVRIRLLPNQGWRVSGHACTSPTQIVATNHRAPSGWI
ncbi:Nn.00g044080.m01.CDS01 [Neocucurbitaria sp. VM-36]